jgi:hypothetical protein
MNQTESPEIVLSAIEGDRGQQLRFFALLNLGVVESLSAGALGPGEAIRLIYNADNCLYVRKHLKNKDADAVMSHGVQLPDLFECLSPEAAAREFLRELQAIRSLSLALLNRVPSNGHLRRLR